MTYVPEVKHKILYTFSRYPVSCDSPNDAIIDVYDEASAFAFTSSHSLQAWDRVKVATWSDKSMPQLLSTIQNDFPASKQGLPKDTQEYHQHRDGMYIIDGIVFYKDHIVIPVSTRGDILNNRHLAH